MADKTDKDKSISRSEETQKTFKLVKTNSQTEDWAMVINSHITKKGDQKGQQTYEKVVTLFSHQKISD